MSVDICHNFDSEQLLILNFMLKILFYSLGNRRNFDKMSEIFVPFSKEFLSFAKIWLFDTKNAISFNTRQKIETMEKYETSLTSPEKFSDVTLVNISDVTLMNIECYFSFVT